MLALNAGKHVFVEKPIALNRAQALETVELARWKRLFFAEALWTFYRKRLTNHTATPVHHRPGRRCHEIGDTIPQNPYGLSDEHQLILRSLFNSSAAWCRAVRTAGIRLR